MTKGIVRALVLLFIFSSHFYVFLKYLKDDCPYKITGWPWRAAKLLSLFYTGLDQCGYGKKNHACFFVFSLAVLLGKIISINKFSATNTET